MSEKKFAPYPDNIAVIGGGRWARVLTGVLCDLVPPSVEISVHSFHNAKSMSAWATARKLQKRIHVSSELPQFTSGKSNAAIVVNAARDHEKAVEWALSKDVPVLVEKPMALTYAGAQQLADLASKRNVRLAAAHVFLFAGYLDHFSKLVADVAKKRSIQSVHVRWTDPQFENRYGEPKQYDPSLPIFADWLPHILSMLDTLTGKLPARCEKVKFLRSGTEVELELFLGDIPCHVQLERNSDQRRRILEVSTGQKKLQLDFSKEPGIITTSIPHPHPLSLEGRGLGRGWSIDDSTTIVGDPDWEVHPRPVAQMLTAFLQWAAGGENDNRLDVEMGLRACQVIDQIGRP